MTFTQSVSTCFKKYVTFSGRARRSEYWWFFLFQTVMPILLFVLGVLLSAAENEFLTLVGALLVIAAIVSWFGLIIPWLAVTWRRLHDAGLAGPWFFISFVPFGSIALIVMCCLETQPKENKFGPVPK